MKKGLVFSIDALFALFLLLLAVPLLFLASSNVLAPAVVNENLHSVSRSAVNLLAETSISDVLTDSYVRDLFAQGVLDSKDYNKTLMEVIGSFWANGDEGNLSIASNLSEYFLSKVMAPNSKWALYYAQDLVYNSSELNPTDSLSLSRRFVSGVAKGLPATGCVARASVQKIGGKNEKSYYFFGGFIGQGNISVLLPSIPSDAVISSVFLELNAGDNFTFFVNGFDCGLFNKTPGNASVDSWSIVDSVCLNNVAKGSVNLFTLNFTGFDVRKHFIGGGFIKITFDTQQLNPGIVNYSRIYFAGVNGLINEYSSFYVPGDLINITASLHLRNNYTTLFTVGNETILNDSGGSLDERIVTVPVSAFTGAYSLSDLSLKTIPFRLSAEANITGGEIGNADIILVTDVSGSMAWRVDTDSVNGVTVTNCSSPDLFFGNTSRISVAKCVDKAFIDTILETEGNRIGLVSFSSSVVNYYNLTTDASALKAHVDSYVATGSTCIPCSINKAYDLLSQWPSEDRNRFVVMMTDGVVNVRATDSCFSANSFDVESGFGALVGPSGAIAHYPYWVAVTSPDSTNLRSVDVFNSTLGFAVGDSYRIYEWNGSSWTLDSDLGSQTLYGVSMVDDSLAFAVGASGKIARWLGGSWSEYADAGSDDFYAVKMLDSTLGFAVGETGRIYRWNGSTWSLQQDVGSYDLHSVDVYSSSLAFAGGDSGKIYSWTGGSWSEYQDLGNFIITSIDIFDSNLAFVTTDNNRIYQWTGGSWTQVYSGSYDLNTVKIINSTAGFALGDSRAGAVFWDGSTWTQFFPPYLYSGNLTTGTSCSDLDSCSLSESIPMLNANYSSCRVHNEQKSTVHTVGFGPITSCNFGNSTLQAMASCGNGTAYLSNNASELQFAFQNIANNIIQQSTTSQTVFSAGNVSTELYSDSYLELFYDSVTPGYAFNEILLTQETNQFPSCQGSFFVPLQVSVDSVKTTSYSTDLWTSNVTLINSNGSVRVFYLGDYGSTYSRLGDPFFVEFPANLVKTGENNLLNVKLGFGALNESSVCSQDNRVIHNLRFKAVVGYSSIFLECKARNATVYYDSDFDGVPDGAVNLSVGEGLESAGSEFVGVELFNTTSNAVDDALLRLLSFINLVNDTGVGLPGSFTNPVDLQLSESVSAEVLSGQQVPFFWGPTEVTVLVWN
ncbi:MAG: VWA domain-containing protein [Candidatus Micrarchaeota archaeon]